MMLFGNLFHLQSEAKSLKLDLHSAWGSSSMPLNGRGRQTKDLLFRCLKVNFSQIHVWIRIDLSSIQNLVRYF